MRKNGCVDFDLIFGPTNNEGLKVSIFDVLLLFVCWLGVLGCYGATNGLKHRSNLCYMPAVIFI